MRVSGVPRSSHRPGARPAESAPESQEPVASCRSGGRGHTATLIVGEPGGCHAAVTTRRAVGLGRLQLATQTGPRLRV